jgi:hypothetical protein
MGELLFGRRCEQAVSGARRLRGGAAAPAIADHVKRSNMAALPYFLGLLAACEADAQNLDAGSSTIEEALSRASETGQRFVESFLHRIRGDILLKGDPVDPALAEEAYKTAIAVAREQGARRRPRMGHPRPSSVAP